MSTVSSPGRGLLAEVRTLPDRKYNQFELELDCAYTSLPSEKVRALRELQRGEKVTISYTPAVEMLTSAERKDTLLASHGWVCSCDVCVKGTHDDALIRVNEGASADDVAALAEGVPPCAVAAEGARGGGLRGAGRDAPHV